MSDEKLAAVLDCRESLSEKLDAKLAQLLKDSVKDPKGTLLACDVGVVVLSALQKDIAKRAVDIFQLGYLLIASAGADAIASQQESGKVSE